MFILAIDGRPIFFSHSRVGMGGRAFGCLKFRTMRRNADVLLARHLEADPAARREWETTVKLRKDPRVLPVVGPLLRSSSLDELPQLLNVLQGDMALVGPRPVPADELERYGAAKAHYLAVRPGVTGLWQVSGRNNTTYERRVALDREYVERWSPFLDAKILLRTVRVVLTREGAA